MAPLVGITTSLTTRDPERAQLNASYIHAVQGAGGVPVLLPPHLGPHAVEKLLATVDALVLTGGGDVEPARYGEEPHITTTGVSEARDAVEVEALEQALRRGIGVLAICRGMQILNVALGGSLHQDIPSLLPGALVHAVAEPREGPAHTVRTEPGSRLATLVGREPGVNSRHHQAVNAVAPRLVVTALAPDGVVEGLEMPGHAVVAVQWHPEDMTTASAEARALFAWACGRGA